MEKIGKYEIYMGTHHTSCYTREYLPESEQELLDEFLADLDNISCSVEMPMDVIFSSDDEKIAREEFAKMSSSAYVHGGDWKYAEVDYTVYELYENTFDDNGELADSTVLEIARV